MILKFMIENISSVFYQAIIDSLPSLPIWEKGLATELITSSIDGTV